MAIQYVGARYVPKYIGPWDSNVTYEPLSIVTDAVRNSYISKTSVPAGTELSNPEYWAISSTYDAMVAALEDRVDTLEGFEADVESGKFSTPSLYPAPRDSVTVRSQAEFRAFLDRFRMGTTSANAVIVEPGTYSFDVDTPDDYAVVNAFQMHINAAVAGVVLDLEGTTFYNGHVRFIGTAAGRLRVIDSAPGGRTAYFEDCSVFAEYTDWDCSFRAWWGHAYLIESAFRSGALGSSIDVLGGQVSVRNCSFSYVPSENEALIGLGYDGCISLYGRNQYPRGLVGGYVFRNRQSSSGRVVNNGSVYDPVNGRAYTTTNRGDFPALIAPGQFVDISDVSGNETGLHALTSSPVSYSNMIYRRYGAVEGI